MTLSALAAVLSLLNADTALRALLGGAGRVTFGSLPESEQIPGVYVSGGTSDRSASLPGYTMTGHRTNDDTARADSFAMTVEAAQALDDRAVAAMFAGADAAGLKELVRTGMAAQPDPDRPGLWHAASTFSFRYNTIDTV